VRLELVLLLIIQNQTATSSAIKKASVGCKKSSDRPGPPLGGPGWGYWFCWGSGQGNEKIFSGAVAENTLKFTE